MSASTDSLHEFVPVANQYQPPGTMALLPPEAFIFGGLLAARFFLWGGTRPDLPQLVPFLITNVLLFSSFFMYRAMAIANDDRKNFNRGLLATAILGSIFFFGVVFFEWGFSVVDGVVVLGNHIKPTDGVYGAVFYGMTGLHALHVVSGVILILMVWTKGRRGHFSAERHWGVEATAIYWHYVDVVWVFFYPALYLIGTAVGGGHGG